MDEATAPTAEDKDRLGDAHELKGVAYELFILLVTGLSLVNTVIVILPFEGPVQQVALLVDSILSPIFLVDFLYRLRTAPSRSTYVWRRFGWADAIGAIPALGVFRIFRAVRVIRLLRRKGLQEIGAELDVQRANATFLLTVFLVIVVVEFAGMAVYLVEVDAPGSNIRSASDAVWWGFVTITTVGYGDQYPVTNIGRVIGTFLLFAGIALFSVLTAFIANAFLAPRTSRRFGRNRPGIDDEVAALRTLLAEQEERAVLIRQKVDEIERAAVLASRTSRAHGEGSGTPPGG